jgi:hypothetical protein
VTGVKYWLLATGSREYTDRAHVQATLKVLQRRYSPKPGEIGITHGAARGADTLVGEEAAALGWAVDPVPCTNEQWRRHGKRAGHLRNKTMVDRHEYRGRVAFPLGLSAGTRGAMVMAEDAGIKVWNRGDPPLPDGMYRVIHGQVCAGFEVRRGVVVACAPVLRARLAEWWRHAENPFNELVTLVA